MAHRFIRNAGVYALVLFTYAFALAQPPAANPASMQFSNVEPYRITLSFDSVGAAGFMVIKGEQPIADIPSNGIVYQKGQGLSSGKVISFGPSRTVNVREVLENTTYYFAIFAYNGSGSNIQYTQINPTLGSITTPEATNTTYYAGVDSNEWNFIPQLNARISPHTFISYSTYSSTMVPVLYERDTINGGGVINCEYSGVTTTYVPPFNFGSANYNREHALPRSWMPTGGSTNAPEGADFHNLIFTHATPNQNRSNNPLGIVVNPTKVFGDSKLGLDATGKLVFEPMDRAKGDVARAMFYQMISYNGKQGNWGLDYLLTLGPTQDQNILKLWHQQDPPDKFERTKNAYIASLQNNRNPFIDNPGWVQCINFDSLVKTLNCGDISSINSVQNLPLSIYPNPAYNQLWVNLEEFANTENYRYRILDALGREFLTGNFTGSNLVIDVTTLPAGMYLIDINSPTHRGLKLFSVLN